MYEMDKEDIHYVEWTARKFFRVREYEPSEDDMQSVLEIVVGGATHYDPNRGVKFISYAHPWIKKAVSRIVNTTRMSVDTGLPISTAYKTDISYHLKKFQLEDLNSIGWRGVRVGGNKFYNHPMSDCSTNDLQQVYEDIDLIKKTMPYFPPKLQDVLLRHYFNGEKYTDLADEFGYKSGRSLSAHIGQWCKKVGQQLEDEVA